MTLETENPAFQNAGDREGASSLRKTRRLQDFIVDSPQAVRQLPA